MKTAVLQHPAVLFGEWLQQKRRESGVVARVLAGRIGLTPAEYAELESGIIHWLGEKQELTIPLLLGLEATEDSVAEFKRLLSEARAASALEFADIFSEEELAPARCSSSDGEQIDETKRLAIIKAVFTPLARNA